MEYIVIDLETTGLDLARCEIIEIGEMCIRDRNFIGQGLSKNG